MFTFSALLLCAPALQAATIYVAAGGDLQAALDNAQPGDTILLAENAEFVGNFVLPAKSGDAWITVRSAAPDTVLPGEGVRIRPSNAPLLARLRSANTSAALRTAPGAHHWDIRYLDFPANQYGAGDIIQIGDGSSAQNTLDKVPHHIVLSHVYVHGDPQNGQKRGIALNGASVTISDSYISECKGIGQDTQAIGGWNGPGPYVIENNYLEAAGENVLVGGADPAIPNLVTDGIEFRGNYLSRPMTWRDPIVPTPQGVTVAATAGGSLAAGTYAYRVIARRTVGMATTARSSASPEVQVTLAAPGAVRVAWQAVPGAAEYRVYGRTAGGENVYWTVTTTEFTDVGASGTSEAVPTSAGTMWSVKNIFELKNARNVVVEGNIFENHWKESQPGFAIVLTPRNSSGACTWCVVENVRFDYNIVRNAAAGINLLGYDVPARPSRQTVNMSFSHNLFQLATSLGGNGWFMQIGDEPRNVAIKHNTVDSNGNALMYTYGGTATDPREILGLEMLANASRHGSYGMNGQFFAYGNAILNGFYPGAVFTANYLAAGSAARYPVGTLTAGLFQDQFTNVALADYTVRAGSILKGAAPDGTDIGADFTALSARVSGVVSGVMGTVNTTVTRRPIPPTAEFTSSCTFLSCTFSDSSITGTDAIVSRSWNFGDAASGTGLAAVHAYVSAGTFDVTLTVTDGAGRTNSTTKSIAVVAPVPPTADARVSCVYLECSYSEASVAGSGAITSRIWNFGDGSAPVEDVASGAHVYARPGSYTVTLAVSDVNGLSSSSGVRVDVDAPNVAPIAAFTPSCADLVCTFADASTDVDGTVTGWAWSFGSATSTERNPTFSFAAPGTYTVTLTVTDDDGAQAAVAVPVQVTGLLHAGYSGSTTRWSSASGATNYWSAEVTVAIHGANERIVPGATVTAVWTGAVSKTVTCVTNANGTCVLKSGTLSYLRSSVTLTVSAVASPAGVYSTSGNHDAVRRTPALTLIRP